MLHNRDSCQGLLSHPKAEAEFQSSSMIAMTGAYSSAGVKKSSGGVSIS